MEKHVDFVRYSDYNRHETSFTRWSNMDYISIKQLSEKWGISTRRIQILCRDGRISGVMRIANTWAVPADAEKPKDARVKSGKFRKNGD